MVAKEKEGRNEKDDCGEEKPFCYTVEYLAFHYYYYYFVQIGIMI